MHLPYCYNLHCTSIEHKTHTPSRIVLFVAAQNYHKKHQPVLPENREIRSVKTLEWDYVTDPALWVGNVSLSSGDQVDMTMENALSRNGS